MKKLALLGLACVVAFLTAAAYTASPARAHTLLVGPGDNVSEWWNPNVDNVEWQRVADLLQEFVASGTTIAGLRSYDSDLSDALDDVETYTNPVTGLVNTDDEVIAGLEAALADSAPAVLPFAAGAGIVGAGAAAAYVGYKYVGPWIGNNLYSLLHSDDSLSATWGYQWAESTGSGSVSVTGFPTIGGTSASNPYANPIWIMQCGGSLVPTQSSCRSSGGAGSVAQEFCDPTASATYSTCYGGAGTTAANHAVSDEAWAWVTGAGANTGITLVYNTSATNACGNVPIHTCYIIVRTEAAQEANTLNLPTTVSGWSAAPVDKTSSTGSSPELDQSSVSAALNQLQSCARTGQATMAAACEAGLQTIGRVVDPTWAGPGTVPVPPSSNPQFVLPQPLSGESYDAYRDRLRQLGYLGNVVVTDDTMTYPDGSDALSLTPTSITQVTVTPGTGAPVAVPVFDPATGDRVAWPNSPPYVNPGTGSKAYPRTKTIEITKVPDDYSPPAGPTTGVCTTGVCFPSIASPCDKFPFGFFCWFPDQLNALLTVDAQPPSVTFPAIDFGSFIGADLSTPSLTLDAADLPSPFATFIAALRDVLAFLVWLLGVYFLGTRLLRARGGADTGTEA